MQREEFAAYLRSVRRLEPTTVRSRLGNCSTIELYEGDLDTLFEADGLKDLQRRMIYSRDDERSGAPARHRIPIDGNIYNGTATLKSALNLYIAFKNGDARAPRSTNFSHNPVRTKKTKSRDWPEWDQPHEEDSLTLARIVAKYIKFLSPEIIDAIARDNEKHRSTWSEKLDKRGVNPKFYLWEGSPCAFPGVRRHAGSKEINLFRDSNIGYSDVAGAICLDDNDYPKQAWSFVFRNAQFSKFGPGGYRLAHLIDHKEHGNRMKDELSCEHLQCPDVLPGLYTCPSNTAYVPGGLLLPTDFNRDLRNLLQRRAEQIYGSSCNLYPPGLSAAGPSSADWELSEFDWTPCVGTLEYMDAFLDFRSKRMERLFRQSEA